MKTRRLSLLLFVTPIFLAGADEKPSLADQVIRELRVVYYDDVDSPPPIHQRLLKLGNAKAIVPILISIAEANATAQEYEPGARLLSASVFALGKIGDRQGTEVVARIARSGQTPDSIRIYAVQSIGELDPEGHRDLLVGELSSKSFSIRRAAAEGLAKTNDKSALMELDVAASREPSSGARRRLQELADGMRTRLNKTVNTK